MGVKIQQKNQTPFGGISFVNDEFTRSGLSAFWGRLPCSAMNHNTVYLILTAMMKNFYNHIVQKMSEVRDRAIFSTFKHFFSYL
ncbi:MAG: hypothetical protein LBC19_16785 [Tannerella sp.]|jgi:hypothetical protein|nr:hypothetical protein [Tannerella sp.]